MVPRHGIIEEHMIVAGDHSKQDQTLLEKTAKYTVFCVYRRPNLPWSPVMVSLRNITKKRYTLSLGSQKQIHTGIE